MTTHSPMLRISSCQRRLETADGEPFFYLADTAWEIASKLLREEVEYFLDVRAAQEFTVLQIVAINEHSGLNANRYGHVPLIDNDPAKPNDKYFEHLDFIIESANRRGVCVALLPTWGDKVFKAWGEGPEVFNATNARAWGRWIGRRYRDAHLIWVIGGDRSIENDEHLKTWRELAIGVAEGDEGRHLRTFHPPGTRSSSNYMHNESWLDFNMIQSGHGWPDAQNWEMVRHDTLCYPRKPTLDGEPRYEDHPINANHTRGMFGYFGELDVRKALYHALLAGACGHTYGCHPVWQFYDPARGSGINRVRTPWQAAIHLPGANQVRFARRLMMSRPWMTLVPEQGFLFENPGWADQHRQAARTEDRRHAFVYISDPRPLRVLGGHLVGDSLRAHWFDPRTGQARFIGEQRREDVMTFYPPVDGDGPDWVLCVDEASTPNTPPGRKAGTQSPLTTA